MLLLSQLKILSLIKVSRMRSALITEMQIEDVLSSIISKTDINRAVLSKIHNGGHRLVIGSEKKVSVVIEPEDSLEPYTKPVYISFPVDRNYLEVISEMMETDTFVFHRTEKVKPGIMKRKNESDNIRGTFHFFIALSDTGIYYAFLGTTLDPDFILSDPKQLNIISEKITLLRKKAKRAIRKKLLT